MRSPITVLLLAALTSCGLFQTADVKPVVEVAQAKDAEFAAIVAGFTKLVLYAQANGAPAATVQVYGTFISERKSAYDTLAFAELAALADLGEVSLAEIIAAAKDAAHAARQATEELN